MNKCYGPNWAPLHPDVEALTLSVTLFEDKAFKQVMNIEWNHKGGALIH